MIFSSSEFDYPANKAIWAIKHSPDCEAGDGKIFPGQFYTVEWRTLTDTKQNLNEVLQYFFHDDCAESIGAYDHLYTDIINRPGYKENHERRRSSLTGT